MVGVALLLRNPSQLSKNNLNAQPNSCRVAFSPVHSFFSGAKARSPMADEAIFFNYVSHDHITPKQLLQFHSCVIFKLNKRISSFLFLVFDHET